MVLNDIKIQRMKSDLTSPADRNPVHTDYTSVNTNTYINLVHMQVSQSVCVFVSAFVSNSFQLQ